MKPIDDYDYEEDNTTEYTEDGAIVPRECPHRWKYVGQNKHGTYYVCEICGDEEET